MAPNDWTTPMPPDFQVILARPVSAPPPPSPMELATLSRRAALLDLILVLVVTLLLPFGFGLAAAAWVADAEPEIPAIPILTVHKWFDAALALTLLGYLILRHGLPAASFGLRNDRPLVQTLWSAGTVAATYAWLLSTIVIILAAAALHPSLEGDLMERTKLLGTMPVHDWRQTLLLLVPVAIHEEIIFRGLLLPLLRRIVGSWWAAIVISTALFAMLHITQGWVGVFQVFGVGAALAVFFVWSRSLPAVILAHFVFNFLQFQLIRWVTDSGVQLG